MAKKNEAKLDFSQELKRLKTEGPERLYLLWGPEDYLRENFLGEIKKLCLSEGEDSFSYRRLNGPGLDVLALQEAVDAPPFLSERSLIELRDVDLNGHKEPDKLLAILKDLPDYCTVVLILPVDYEPDGRLKLIKGLRACGRDLKFEQQSQSALINWIVRRFAAVGKSVDLDTARHLIFVSGDLMNRLIPEIEKVAAYASGERVTVADVDAVANHIPEAVIFEMTEAIAQKKTNSAVAILAEALENKENEPIPMTAMLGLQMRQLYAARLAAERDLGLKYIMDACEIKYDFVARRLLQAARGFSLPQLRRAVELCGETDYRMKSSGGDSKALFEELVLRIAAGESGGTH